MGVRYGVPFSRPAQVNRWLRRGTDGLVSGRSEAAAPVRLGKGRIGRKQTVSTVQGEPGPPGVPNDDDWVRNVRSIANTGSIWSGSFFGSNTTYRIGQGIGRGGFFQATTFAFDATPPGGWWYEGFATTTNAGEALFPFDFVGVWQQPADSGPRFVHNDASGAATSVATGFGRYQVGLTYEIRMFADPHRSDVAISFAVYDGVVPLGLVSYTASSNLPVNPIDSTGGDLDTVITNGTDTGMSHTYLWFVAVEQPIGLTINS